LGDDYVVVSSTFVVKKCKNCSNKYQFRYARTGNETIGPRKHRLKSEPVGRLVDGDIFYSVIWTGLERRLGRHGRQQARAIQLSNQGSLWNELICIKSITVNLNRY
jgi:hypothetical protein